MAESLPVECAGCGSETPYATGEAPAASTSYGEWQATPLGLCFVRTCWRRECVRAARLALDGRRVAEPLSRVERERLAAA